MNSIFISYASQDVDFALKLAEDLRERGHEAITFADLKTDEEAGSDLEQKLIGAIASASCVIPILTPATQDRCWFEEEIPVALYDEASVEGLKILPVLIEPCVLPENLGVRPPVDFSKSYAEGLHTLCARLVSLLGLDPPPDAPRRQRTRDGNPDLVAARDRYAELVDKKFGSHLTEAEQAELQRLRSYLDEAESDFYEPIKKRLDLALAQLSPSSER